MAMRLQPQTLTPTKHQTGKADDFMDPTVTYSLLPYLALEEQTLLETTVERQ